LPMQAMRDLMRLSLADSLRKLSEEDRLAAALPVVCGSAMAAHCAVERLDGERTLHLRVGREWLNPLLGMRDILRGDLARTAGVQLHDLHFEVTDAAVSRHPGASQAVPTGSGRPRTKPPAPGTREEF
jgi:hypothetical protein